MRQQCEQRFVCSAWVTPICTDAAVTTGSTFSTFSTALILSSAALFNGLRRVGAFDINERRHPAGDLVNNYSLQTVTERNQKYNRSHANADTQNS